MCQYEIKKMLMKGKLLTGCRITCIDICYIKPNSHGYLTLLLTQVDVEFSLPTSVPNVL